MTIFQKAKILKETLPASKHVKLIHDKVITTHSHALLDKIIKLYRTVLLDNRRNELKTLLKDNWALIQGTYLCYTALPNHGITHLMAEIACEIATARESAFSLLLPEVSTEPTNLRDYDDLALKCVAPSDFTKLFNTHFLSRDGRALIPVSVLTTENFLTTNQLPNVYFDAFHPDYQTLPPEELEKRSTLDDSELKRLKAHSPLTRELFDAKSAYLELQQDNASLQSQLMRLLDALYRNSSEVNNAYEALSGTDIAQEAHRFYQYYRQLEENQRTRIPQPLRYEIELLEVISSAQKYFFTEDAFKRVVTTSLDFFEKNKAYYSKKALDNLLMAQRNDYLDKAKKKQSGINAIREIQAIDSCFATRFQRIKQEMTGHDLLLSTIGISDEAREKTLSNACDDYNDALDTLKQRLSQAPDNSPYEGFDKGLLTPNIIDKTKAVLTFSDMEDALFKIGCLHEEELPFFFKNAITEESLLRHIQNANNLAALLLGLPLRLLRPLLQGLNKKNFSNKIRGFLYDSVEVLNFLSQDKKNCFLDAVDISQTDRLGHTLLMICIIKGKKHLISFKEEPTSIILTQKVKRLSHWL